MTLPPSANSDDIVNKLEKVFGNVASRESVVQEFYTVAQEENESVTLWGIRIETILQRAIGKGYATSEQKDRMSEERFWRSLYSSELQNATRVQYESASTFEILRPKVRAEGYAMATQKSHRQIR